MPSMQRTLCLLSLSIALCLCTLTVTANSEGPVHIVYMSPAQASDPFDSQVVDLMRKAASDFDFKLTVVNVVKNQVYNQQRINNIFKLKPDYLVLSYQIYTDQVLQQAELWGIKSFIINSPIPDVERELIGYPRGKFKNWIGHIYPDDYTAGHQLTQLIHQKSQAQDNAPATPSLLAFNGHRATASARDRRRGLMDAALELDIHIRHIYAADWDPDITTRQLPQAVRRYPQADLFWAASDAIALRIIEHMKVLNKHPNKDFYTAGIDWSEQGLNRVKSGDMVASIGGHFLTGAWAMVQIYDYHNNHDFEEFGAETMVKMAVADSSNISHIQELLRDRTWQSINFKDYTQSHHSNTFSHYNFSVENIFGDLPVARMASKK